MIKLLTNEYEDALRQASRMRTRPLYLLINDKDDSVVVSDKPIDIEALTDFIKEEADDDEDALRWAKKYLKQSKESLWK